jgi:hypothetical protein
MTFYAEPIRSQSYFIAAVAGGGGGPAVVVTETGTDPAGKGEPSTGVRAPVGELARGVHCHRHGCRYVSIFTTANDIIRELVGVPDADAALKALDGLLSRT